MSIRAMAGKELRQLSRDKRTLAVLLVGIPWAMVRVDQWLNPADMPGRAAAVGSRPATAASNSPIGIFINALLNGTSALVSLSAIAGSLSSDGIW